MRGGYNGGIARGEEAVADASDQAPSHVGRRMSFPVTVALAGALLGLTILFGWRGGRASRPLASPRLIPWRLLMLLAFTLMIAVLVHLVSLMRGSSAPTG